MWRLIKKTGFFFGMFCVANIVFVCVGGELLPKSCTKHFLRYKRYGGGHLFARLEEARHTKGVDILFVGTSHCYRGFDTRIFGHEGYSAFNLGSSIQTALQTDFLLDRYLDSLKPKSVIFEVNPVIFGNDGSESAIDIISNDRIDWQTVAMAFKVNRYKVYNTLIFGLYRQVTGIDMYSKEPAVFRDDRYISGGFVESKLIGNRSFQSVNAAPYVFESDQLEAFDQVLSKFRKRKIPYILVQAPITKNLYNSKTNNAQVDSMLARKGQYYNFNKLVAMNDTTDFFDQDHLSQRGVEKFNSALIAVLRRDGFLQ
jgi:hypothetical protein